MDELYAEEGVEENALEALKADMERRGLKWEDPRG
jgi:hypothetical protein